MGGLSRASATVFVLTLVILRDAQNLSVVAFYRAPSARGNFSSARGNFSSARGNFSSARGNFS
jgi:hypothetical protein